MTTRHRSFPVAAMLAFAATLLLHSATAQARTPACPAVGDWLLPATGRTLSPDAIVGRLAAADVVLLGERHDQPEHHRWQLHTLAALHARRPDMVIGFEMFPRRAQDVLDRWVRGELTERELLEKSRWDEVWGFDADLYLPLFHFARMHRVPMVALNVNRELVREVREQGWANVPRSRREGVGDPATPPPAYRERLLEVYRHHETGDGERDTRLDAERFIQAQLLWDRAMAEGLARRVRARGPLVVGVIGSGHLEYGHGVPHQLGALGVRTAHVALPWDRDRDCHELAPDIAFAVFGLSAPRSANGTPLGVMLAPAEEGVQVVAVEPGSVAEAAGLLANDVIREAAGRPVRSATDLVTAVRRQPPGTWLPLLVERDGTAQQVVAQFPAEP